MCTSGTNGSSETLPEVRLAKIMYEEAGTAISPQVLRLIIKYRWDEIAKAAHEIHGSEA